MLEFESNKLKVKVDGVVHEMSYPCIDQIEEFDKQLAEGKGKEIELTREFFEKLGMPKEVFNKLRFDWVLKISEELRAIKKK